MILCSAEKTAALSQLLARYGLRLEPHAVDAAIPGSYWGAPEAGLVGTTVHIRADTPLHSVLHEAAHAICMDDERLKQLHTDAGGDYDEENAVCYLEIVLAGQLEVAPEKICADMDTWGYTFRLGSAHAWYKQDAEDARQWLLHRSLITPQETPTWKRRGPVVSGR